MLKVYKYEMVFEDATDDTCIAGYSGFQLMDENKVQNKKEILTWDEVFSQKSGLHFLRRDYTFFKKRPYFSYCDFRGNERRFYKSDKKFNLYITYKENNSLTLIEIMKGFPSDKVIQYLKEQGLNICPML